MAYATGDIPAGAYSSDRLSNIGIGHGAIDGGGAYTYLNTKTGTEASATLGFTKASPKNNCVTVVALA
jgi:Protein involved in meta-pathway of phenol degradation